MLVAAGALAPDLLDLIYHVGLGRSERDPGSAPAAANHRSAAPPQLTQARGLEWRRLPPSDNLLRDAGGKQLV